MLRIWKFKKRKINLYFLPHKDREIIIKPVIDKQINDVLRCILNICWDLLFETKKKMKIQKFSQPIVFKASTHFYNTIRLC
jgi:hypothetical protein